MVVNKTKLNNRILDALVTGFFTSFILSVVIISNGCSFSLVFNDSFNVFEALNLLLVSLSSSTSFLYVTISDTSLVLFAFTTLVLSFVFKVYSI